MCLNRSAYGISFRSDEPPHFSGGYAEFIYLRPGTAIFKLSDVSPETVIGAGCALVTAIHGLERTGINWGVWRPSRWPRVPGPRRRS
jgi:D-arabinose 1-dehydrogenase-like Zn-dependent alcohol dehydrogenase